MTYQVSVRDMNSNITMDLPVQTTLGKRKPSCLSGCDNDVHECELDVTLLDRGPKVANLPSIEAVCWVRDEEGRSFGMLIPAESLQTLVEQYARMKARS